jgi:hypothetical protein
MQVKPVPSKESHTAKFIKDHFVSALEPYGIGLDHLRICSGTVDSASTNMTERSSMQGLKTVLGSVFGCMTHKLANVVKEFFQKKTIQVQGVKSSKYVLAHDAGAMRLYEVIEFVKSVVEYVLLLFLI